MILIGHRSQILKNGDRRPETGSCLRSLSGFSFLILLISLMVSSSLHAQNRVNILRADSIEGGSVNGEGVQKILGHVYLESETLKMYCDSAYQFVNKSEIRAFGNIEIDTEEENIWADTLIYFTDVDFSQLRGRVIIEADSATLFGNSVDYRFSTKVAHFINHVRLEDPEGTLIADSGFYYREADSAVFRGHVQLSDSLQYIEGDSLFSNRRTKYYELYGNFFADDKENNSMLKGDYLEADSTGRRLVEGNAWLKNVKKGSPAADTASSDSTLALPPPDTSAVFRPDSLAARRDSSVPELSGADSSGMPDIVPIHPDSLAAALDTSVNSRPDSLGSRRDTSFIRPDTAITPPDTSDSSLAASSDSSVAAQPDTTHMRAKKIILKENRMQNDTTSTTRAYGNVRIWSRKFASVSDTAQYESDTETFELWSDPKAWHKQIQLTGPYIKVILEDGDIQRLESYPQPFSVQQDTVIDRLNQIKGDTMNVYFTNGDVSEIHVYGNSHLLRFMESKEKEAKADGAIDMTAPSTFIFFENGELKKLKGVGAIDGSRLPESEQTKERKLDGFSWNPEVRPRRPEQKMEPRFPPISEKRPFKLPKRYQEHIKKKKPAKNKN